MCVGVEGVPTVPSCGSREGHTWVVVGGGEGLPRGGGRWAGKGKGVQEGRIGAIGSGGWCVMGVVGS